MALIKCKMCGGDLRLEEGSTVCECEYCGTKQTVPKLDDEKKLKLFERANRLRAQCEFDKAAGVYEAIVADFPEEAEAYWGLVLCKYGIEYVDDPATGKKIPTCHRSSFDNVLKDANFEQACEYTDAVARRVYRDEARAIEELRRGILEVSGKEEPYDVFISYKEKDENGERTPDSVIAQDIYRELTREGYRVFFSRISLENRLGTEYEPYIFAALNSAKVMIVVGTDYENFDAVWVKNEWSRFLKLIAAGQKKTLIPVFKNMDAYDMPEEFNKLTALDMGKLGAMQDLVRGVEKLIGKKGEAVKETVKETVVVQQSGGPNVTALLKRGQQALEDGDWDRAKEYFDRVLDMDAENSDAFFGLFLAGTQCGNENGYIRRACTKEAQTEKLSIQPATERIRKAIKQYAVKDYLSEQDIQNLFQYDLSYSSALKAQQRVSNAEKQAVEQDRNFSRATRYARNDEAAARRFKARLFAELDAAVKKAKEREAAAREKKQQNYDAFLDAAEKKAEEKYRQALDRQEADRQKELAEQEAARKKKLEAQEAAYEKAVRSFKLARLRSDYQTVKKDFLALVPYKDSAAMAKRCDEEIAAIEKAQAEEAERQRIAKAKAEKAAQAKKKRLTIAAILIVALVIAGYFTYTKVIFPGKAYRSAEALYEAGQYEQAIAAFKALGDYKDSAGRIEEVKAAALEQDYIEAIALFDSGKYKKAFTAFSSLGSYKDSSKRMEEAKKLYSAAHDEVISTPYDVAELLPGTYKIGIAIYQFDDIFMTLYRNELLDYFKSLETDDLKFDVTIVDGKNDMAEQNNQIDNFITQGMDAIILNLVQTSSADAAIDKIVEAGIPCILINREPLGDKGDESYEGILNNATVCYVGADARQSGTYQGEIIAELPNNGDINGDGKVSYIMIEGDPENIDAQYRTEFSVKALKDAGIEVEELDDQIGNWAQAKGQEICANDLAKFGDKVEVVFCNNDAMALGAATAIKAADRTVGKDIYLVGIDALDVCVEMVNEGTMTGTVLNDAVGQSHAAVNVTLDALAGLDIDNYYWVNYVKITNDRDAWSVACRTVGSTVTFGSYEQDNDTSNGKEPIEWIVLDVKDNRSLLISKYALDCQPYNTSYGEATWETCSLRKWLNSIFLNAAFNAEEQSRIISSEVPADKNPSHKTSPGNNTTDTVFLLSIPEANQYFKTDEDRRCEPTAYAKGKGCYVNPSVGACWWWLRSPGISSNNAARVIHLGNVYPGGEYVHNSRGTVRPAMWIDLDA